MTYDHDHDEHHRGPFGRVDNGSGGCCGLIGGSLVLLAFLGFALNSWLEWGPINPATSKFNAVSTETTMIGHGLVYYDFVSPEMPLVTQDGDGSSINCDFAVGTTGDTSSAAVKVNYKVVLDAYPVNGVNGNEFMQEVPGTRSQVDIPANTSGYPSSYIDLGVTPIVVPKYRPDQLDFVSVSIEFQGVLSQEYAGTTQGAYVISPVWTTIQRAPGSAENCCRTLSGNVTC